MPLTAVPYSAAGSRGAGTNAGWQTTAVPEGAQPSDAAAASDLQAERDRLAQIVEVLPIGVVLMDASGKVLLENQLTRDLFDRAQRPAPGLAGRAAAARGTAGTGLGLYVARDIARLHGGTLSLESTGSAGSVFKLSLPLGSDADPQPSDPGSRLRW